LNNRTKIIAITGAESTGKSTLSKALSEYFDIPFIPEYARNYVLTLNRHYDFSDVELIARKQIEQFNEAFQSDHKIVILDTWLIITKIWFEVVFNSVPDWIDEAIKSHPIDMFLVCNTDLPWIEDSVRENGGEMREKLQKKYIKEIQQINGKYEIVSGEYNSRLKQAIQVIESII